MIPVPEAPWEWGLALIALVLLVLVGAGSWMDGYLSALAQLDADAAALCGPEPGP